MYPRPAPAPAIAESDLRDIALIQSALRGDFEFIARYGEEHPGAWAGAWFEDLDYVVAPGPVLAQGPDAPPRPRRPSNKRARRAPDADHDHPPRPGTQG